MPNNPAMKDRSRNHPTHHASTRATVTNPTNTPAARVSFFGFRIGRSHTRQWMMTKTFTAERAARNNAKPPTTNALIRLNHERSRDVADRLRDEPADAGLSGGGGR